MRWRSGCRRPATAPTCSTCTRARATSSCRALRELWKDAEAGEDGEDGEAWKATRVPKTPWPRRATRLTSLGCGVRPGGGHRAPGRAGRCRARARRLFHGRPHRRRNRSAPSQSAAGRGLVLRKRGARGRPTKRPGPPWPSATRAWARRLREEGAAAFMDWWETLPLFASAARRFPSEVRAAIRAERDGPQRRAPWPAR